MDVDARLPIVALELRGANRDVTFGDIYARAVRILAALDAADARPATSVPAAFEAYLQALEAGGAHVDRADPENEGMWRRHFDAGKPASDFVPKSDA